MLVRTARTLRGWLRNGATTSVDMTSPSRFGGFVILLVSPALLVRVAPGWPDLSSSLFLA